MLYGGPGPLLQRDPDGTERVVGFSTVSSVFKASGAAVELGLFTDDRLADVSAVFFSSLATWSKVSALACPSPAEVQFVAVRCGPDLVMEHIVAPDRYEETLADGAHLFINPHARRPLEPDPWFSAGCCVHQYMPSGTLTRMHASNLVQRFSRRVVPVPAGTVVSRREPPTTARPATRSYPADGVFYAGPAVVGTCDLVELTLYRGWTLAVGRDRYDDDWACLYKPIRALTVQEFIAFEGGDLTPFVTTREEAVEVARRAIDSELGTQFS